MRHRSREQFVFICVILWGVAAVGCKDDDTGSTPHFDAGDGTDSGTTAEDSGADSGSDADAGTDSGEPLCADGLPPHEFDTTAQSFAYDEPSPDFSLNTTAGVFSLSEAWTGCDNYVFVMYRPAYGADADTLWYSDTSEIIDDSDENTHYFFVTLEEVTEPEREARVREIESAMEIYLETTLPETQTHWRERLHYVVDRGLDIPVVAEVLGQNNNEIHFTIDRHQLVREGHNVSYYMGAWQPQLRNTRYWAKYYNAQYKLDLELAEEEASGDVLVHRVATGLEITALEPFVWTLPDAATIAEYDRLEVDMHVDCPGLGHPYAFTCGEWDTVGGIWLCGDEECSGEGRRRIIKWITPYSSPGRWLIDIAPELVALAEGGELRFVATHGDNNVGAYTYKYTVDFRFSAAEDGLRPFALETLIPLGNYGFATMDDEFDPFSITPPEGTQKVELYARISGHGAEETAGCAEFCTFEHTFDVNGTPYSHAYLMENENRCAEWVDKGVTPNQGGTWHFDRSSWCPGWVTEEWREDITASFLSGGENTVEHTPTQQGGPPPGGNMDARVELVYYH